MSLAPTTLAAPPRAPSPNSGAMNFSSNNPFRRAVSPGPAPSSSTTTENPRPRMSNNPFLDPPATSAAASKPVSSSNPFESDVFKDLSLLDRSTSNVTKGHRSGTMPTRPARPADKDASQRNRQDPPGSRRPAAGMDIFASPPRTSRPRRNSESSVLDKEKSAEDEKRRRERRKEREARREKEGRSKDGRSSGRTKKPHGLDIIDQLDVTGVYGQGLIHHDGPFDACNPHRNRKKDYRAPMQAFPAGSANNTIGGSGPVNPKMDLDRFHGRGAEGFNDFASSGAAMGPDLKSLMPKKQEVFNPTDRVELLHGEESTGLGTSTFLDGAPAPRSAIERRASETKEPSPSGGLSRKKSLAVRLRGLSQPRHISSERVISPDTRFIPASNTTPGVAQSAGGPSKMGQESNPFFNDYDDAYEKKGTQIRIAESATNGRARAPSSPYGEKLGRSRTADSPGNNGTGEPVAEKSNAVGGGFLNRMKSLKGPRRTRPERTLT